MAKPDRPTGAEGLAAPTPRHVGQRWKLPTEDLSAPFQRAFSASRGNGSVEHGYSIAIARRVR